MERGEERVPGMHAVVDEHCTDWLDCWCLPSYHLACDECDVAEYRGAARVYLPEPPSAAGCWKCDHGLIPITRAEADATDRTLIVVHNQ